MKIKYPIGIQTFSEIITENYLYVDKTELIHTLVNESKYVFLSRPRRFGKSLLVSTLEAYFSGKSDLFHGLQIYTMETDWLEYPVFRLDLSGENFNAPNRLIEHIEWYLERIENRYGLRSEGSISLRFKQLIHKAFEKFGRRVVILIDEYDKPMLDCLDSAGLHEEIKTELRGFYSSIKACDEYIRFVLLTGVTKFGKVSIFSGLNNLKDISLLSRYNAICGISESEFHRDFKHSVLNFANANEISTDNVWERFKAMYDGYHFASKGEDIYNPFSVLNAFQENDLKSYWYATGSSSYLINLIKRHTYLLDRLDGERRSEDELGNITDIDTDFVPLLYQSGYLTIKGYDPEQREYTLAFPNFEVKEAFWKSLMKHFFREPGGGNPFDLKKFVSDLINGNPQEFMTRLQSMFADIDSQPERNKEIHFQNMMAITAKMLGFIVRTEVHSSAGRCDMQILTPNYIYIFEFKINGSCKEAIDQIYKKGYHLPFSADTRSKFLIGANFSTDTRTLTQWIIEHI
ncbi:MAG: ATP-binding protein [Muribaculaceae bacterium]|nr:ATP-binding protein [Muribaculaceae bacterium]